MLAIIPTAPTITIIDLDAIKGSHGHAFANTLPANPVPVDPVQRTHQVFSSNVGYEFSFSTVFTSRRLERFQDVTGVVAFEWGRCSKED